MKKEMKKPKRFADGGGTSAPSQAPEAQDDTEDDEEADDEQAPPQQAAAATPAPQQEPIEEPDQPAGQMQDVNLEDTPATPPKLAKNVSYQKTAAQAMPPPLPTAQEYDAEDIAHAKDMATKAITPKTYENLWGDKGTLGKLGTIFGLMVSGAGSGLAGQPNMLMEMMNKEIERDLESQKTTRSNAQNFLTVAYNHELQNAQTRHYNALIAAGVPQAEAKLQVAQADELNAKNAGLAQKNLAANKMMTSFIQDLDDKTQNNPQANGILKTVLVPAAQQKMQQNNQEAVGQQQLNTALHQASLTRNAPNSVEDSGVDTNKMQKLISMGKFAPDLPGAIPAGDVGQVTKEANDVATNRNLAKIYDNSFKALNSKVLAGALTPSDRAAQIDAVATRIARDSGAMSLDQAKGMLEGMFPQKGDLPKTVEDKYNKAMEHFQGQEAGTTTLDRYKLKTPFPSYKYEKGGKKKTSSTLQQASNTKTVNGVTYTRGPNGEAVPVSQVAEDQSPGSD